MTTETKQQLLARRARERWHSMTPEQRERTLARQKEYQRNRYQARKAAGLIQLIGRRPSTKPTFTQLLQDWVNNQKIARGQCYVCELPCEEWNTVMFAWDHVDPKAKKFSISKALTVVSINDDWQSIVLSEIDKCQLLCHNCHSFRTYVERHHDSSKSKRRR